MRGDYQTHALLELGDVSYRRGIHDAGDRCRAGGLGQAPVRPDGGLPTAQGRSSHTFGISAKVVSWVTWLKVNSGWVNAMNAAQANSTE